jgi:signal transduction histidine kinase
LQEPNGQVQGDALFETVLGLVAQPVCVVDRGGLIRYANAAAAAALGWGDEASRLVGSPLDADACPTIRTRESGENVYLEHAWLPCRDGTPLPVSLWSSAIDLPDGRGAVCTFQESDDRALAKRRLLIEAGDAARHAIAQDLHDGVQQDFATVFINIQLAQQKWTAEPDEARRLVDKAAQHAKLGVAELRNLVAGVHPVILTSRGLGAAIAAFAGRLPLPVRLIGLPQERFAPELEASLYFLVSETLTNAVKHAAASSARVSFEASDKLIALEVADDGIGGVELARAGQGLRGVADRVAALGGHLRLVSEAGEGTSIQVEVPLAS